MAMENSFRALLFLSLFLLNSFKSESVVASIDLGSEWIKVAVVNLKPGVPPISVAINEMSKRKTPSLISFHADSRLIGDESSNLLARYPNKGISRRSFWYLARPDTISILEVIRIFPIGLLFTTGNFRFFAQI